MSSKEKQTSLQMHGRMGDCEDFLAKVMPRPEDTVGHSGAVTPKYFLYPQILLCSGEFFFLTYDKNKNLSP